MPDFDVVIVGGGPAGSECARKLVAAGKQVAVLDRATFPRTKLCAGWVTPEVIRDLDFDITSYPHRFSTFDAIIVHLKGLTFKYKTVQHSIRRYEFDDFLLKRSGAEIIHHHVRNIEREADSFLIDGQFRCRFVVGAGGTRCPIYKALFRDLNPRAKELQIATYEHEFAYDWADPRCHLWFFERDLPGYAWYVPKQDGFLNCGVGGMAMRLKDRDQDIKEHWQHFVDMLARESLVTDYDFKPTGYSYYLRGGAAVVAQGGAFVVGDAIGLATRDMGEGIGPAVQSGQRAATAILTGVEYSLTGIAAHSILHDLRCRATEFFAGAFIPRRRARVS